MEQPYSLRGPDGEIVPFAAASADGIWGVLSDVSGLSEETLKKLLLTEAGFKVVPVKIVELTE